MMIDEKTTEIDLSSQSHSALKPISPVVPRWTEHASPSAPIAAPAVPTPKNPTHDISWILQVLGAAAILILSLWLL